jgi:hypothetical protein
MAKKGREADGTFAKGNLFSVGLQNNGVPPKYSDHKVMMKKIGEYLDWEDQWKNKSAKGEGKGIYTLSGVALYLGFASVQSLYDYEKKSADFAYVINRFRLFMKHWNEQKLYWGGTFQGSFVWLKNHGGYSDESTVNNNVTEYKTEWAKGDEEEKGK